MSLHPFPVQSYRLFNSQTLAVRRKKSVNWTADEDAKLTEAVKQHGAENWLLIAQEVGGGRTRSQCAQRWLRVINPKLKKRNWSIEEDELLLQAVEKVGTKSWAKVASIMGQRCDVQCRYRYQQLTKKQQPTYHSAPVPSPPPIAPTVPKFAAEAPVGFCPSLETPAPKEKIPSIWNIIGGEFAM